MSPNAASSCCVSAVHRATHATTTAAATAATKQARIAQASQSPVEANAFANQSPCRRDSMLPPHISFHCPARCSSSSSCCHNCLTGGNVIGCVLYSMFLHKPEQLFTLSEVHRLESYYGGEKGRKDRVNQAAPRPSTPLLPPRPLPRSPGNHPPHPPLKRHYQNQDQAASLAQEHFP